MLTLTQVDNTKTEVIFTAVYKDGKGIDAKASDFKLVFYSDASSTTIIDPLVNVKLDSYDLSTGHGAGFISTIAKTSINGSYTVRLFIKGKDSGLNGAELILVDEHKDNKPNFDVDPGLNIENTITAIENKFIAMPDEYSSSNSWQIDDSPIIHFKLDLKNAAETTKATDLTVRIYNKTADKEITLLESKSEYDDKTKLGKITLSISRDNRPILLQQESDELSIYVLRKGKKITQDKLTIFIINNPATTEAGQYYHLTIFGDEMDTVTPGQVINVKYSVLPFTDFNNGKYPKDKTTLHFADIDGYTFLSSATITQQTPYQGHGYRFEGSISIPAQIDTTLADLFGIKFKWAVTSGDNHEYLGHVKDVSIKANKRIDDKIDLNLTQGTDNTKRLLFLRNEVKK